jgi:hypothetical protein
MRLREHEKSYRLRFANGISVEILKREGGFGGLGQVKLRRRKLRCDELPVMPLIRTPDGYEVSRLQLQGMERGEEALTIELTPHVRWSGRMEWVCADGEDRWNVASWEQPAERDRGGLVRLSLRAVEREIGGIPFVGFSYAYKFRSRKYRIYRIHDRATWELGGWATANSFWMRHPFGHPQKTVQNKGDSFTTAWRGGEHDDVQIQQFLPLFSVLQGFTFQFDRHTLLVTAFEKPFHCRSLFQKGAGENYIVHWHQLCGDLSGCLEFPALQVLCAVGLGEGPAERADQYCAVREELHRQYADESGLMREAAVVSSQLEPAAERCLETLEHGVDELARAGCKRLYVPGLMVNLGPGRDASAKARREARRRVEGFVEHAHNRGTEVAVSLADCCARWLVEEGLPDGDEEAEPVPGGRELVARALRDGRAGRLLTDHLRRLKRSPGVDALFADGLLDRLANEFGWAGDEAASGRDAPPIVSLHGARERLVASLQKMGYRCPLAGAGGLAGPALRLDYEMLRGREFMFRDCVVEFPTADVLAADDELLEAYLRGYAHRLSYAALFEAGRSAGGRLADWWEPELAAVNKAFQAVREHMECSRLLPGDRGVLWSGPDPDVRVLWCFRRFKWPAGPEAEVFDIMASEPVELQEGEFAPERLRVYLVQNAEGP